MAHDKLKLCPKCPKIPYLPMVKPRSYTRLPTIDSTVKICSKLRHLNLGKPCPHFPKTEILNGWLGAPRRKRRKKRR